MDLGQDALHLLEIGPAAAVEVDAAAPSLEELGVQMLLRGADAVGDGGRGDAELLGGADETPVPGGGFEEAQAVEGRQGYHGFGRGKRWGWSQINRYFVIAQIHLSQGTFRGSLAGVPFHPCGPASKSFSA